MIAICNIWTRPSQQYEFCNYPLNEYCQRDSIGQSDPGGPGGPGGQGGQGGQVVKLIQVVRVVWVV